MHYIQVVMLHIWVIYFECTATWKGCYDMQKVCENIFEGCIVRQKLNIKHVETYDHTMIFILVYAKSFKSIGASFCYSVDLKFVQMLL